jgi:hypothetical protein
MEYADDIEAMEALVRGETIEPLTSERLWRAGYVLVTDVSDHDPPYMRKLMAIRLTPKGKRALEAAKTKR